MFVQTDEAVAIGTGFLYPHFSNTVFIAKAQTIFLRKGYELHPSFNPRQPEVVEGCKYIYDDCLEGYLPGEKQKIAWNKAKEKISATRSAAFIQEYLRILYDSPDLLLVHILSAVNGGNGQPYRWFGFIPDKK